jgi:hypothetical protein
VRIVETFAAEHGAQPQQQLRAHGAAAEQGQAADAAGKRLFLYFALHNTHSPVEAPLRIQSLYAKRAALPRPRRPFSV